MYFEEIERELERMIGEEGSGSLILVGPPGSGKTSLVKRLSPNVNQIWLDGMLCSDFRTNLNFLIGHYRVGSVDEQSFEVFADELLLRHKQCSLPFTLVVLEWLDMFVLGDYVNQQLLYGLLELTSSLPILLIGLTRRVDIVEGMEKRVRSRFSQNVFYLAAERPPDLAMPDFPYSMSLSELLVLLCITRIERNCKLTMNTIFGEYSALRNEIDSSLLSLPSSERQLVLSIEALVSKGLLGFSRNDCYTEKTLRHIKLNVPSFVVPELIAASSSCPVPLKSFVLRT